MTFIYGPGLDQRVDVGAGDSLSIPPRTLHSEANLGDEPTDIAMALSTPGADRLVPSRASSAGGCPAAARLAP